MAITKLPLLAGLALLLPGCVLQSDNSTGYELALPSAMVETRDGASQSELDTPTRIVVLGTGTPIPDAFRAGPSIAVIHRGESYLFDVGAGAVRQATIARYHASAHTPSDQLARLANYAQPATLVLYHGLFYGTEESTVLEEISPLYAGEVVLASDLQAFSKE